MDIDVIRILITIANFIVLYFILRHFLFNPVNNKIDSRVNAIKSDIDKAEADRIEAERLKNENAEKLSKAKEEGKAIVEDYKVKAEKVSEEITSGASNEAQVILERAKKEAEREKEKAEDEIKSQVVELAMLVSSKALNKALDETEHRRLIEDFVAKVGI